MTFCNYFRFVNVEDAIAYMNSIPDEEDATGIDIFLEPPDDGAESDADDPSEDVADVGEENVKLLGAKLLAKPAHVEFTNRNARNDPCLSRTIPVDFQEGKTVGNEEGEQMPPSKKKKKQRPVKPCYTWKKRNFEATPDTDEQVLESHHPSVLHKWSDEGVTPVGIFTELWNDDLMKLIMTETNRYHQAKFGKELFVTVEELYKVFGIFLLSGYNKVPNRRLYWSRQTDTHNLAVSQCGMGVNRFEEIVRSLHFADNSKKPADDKIYKVRPLFEHFNKIFFDFAQPLPMTWAIDEAMEPYYGHHGLKQFIKGKPVRFGYKFWCLCSHEGLLVNFKLYEGKDSGYVEGLTIGESVVQSMALKVVPPGSSGYIDNYFTTLPLMVSFLEANINLTGTIRKDKVKSVPLSDISKGERGDAELFIEEGKKIAVCNWNDNSEVRMATNKTDTASFGMGKCRR